MVGARLLPAARRGARGFSRDEGGAVFGRGQRNAPMVNILYALSIRALPSAASPLASGSLLVALLLMPAGFLLGGIWAQGGDPGLGAVLIPAGAMALVLGVSVVAIGVRKGA
jgi:hypothetical protein